MKSFFRYISLLLALLLSMELFAVKRFYSENSVLAKGKWVKISVPEEGIYQLTAKELANMGFSNPRLVHLHGYGGELLSEDFVSAAYVDDLPEIPTYWDESSQKLVFYLRGTIGFKFNTNNRTKEGTPILFEENYTSNNSYFFLTENATQPLRYVKDNGADEDFEDSSVEEVYKYKSIAIKKFDDANILGSGRNWFGEMCEPNQSRTYTLNFKNLVLEDTMSIYCQVMASANVVSNFYINTDLGNPDYQKCSVAQLTNEAKLSVSTLQGVELQTNSSKVSFDLKYVCTQKSGRGYVDYIIGTASSHLNAQSVNFIRRMKSSDYEYSRFHFSNANHNDVFLDVSDIEHIYLPEVSFSGDSAFVLVKNVVTPNLQRIVNFSPSSAYPSPTVVGDVKNQNLHTLKDLEYIIITPTEFMPEANRLAELHREKDGLSYVILNQETIFNEFSSGTPDPTAIRAFMKMLYDKSKSESGIAPRYLLILGDGCYDNKNNAKSMLNAELNRVITYQTENSYDEAVSYTNDEYYGFLEDDSRGYNDGFRYNTLCVGVGRIPAMNLQQAKELVDKLASYMNNNYFGVWKKKVVFMADDNQTVHSGTGDYHLFTSDTENSVKTLISVNNNFEPKRIYWDAYNRTQNSGSTRYPEVDALMRESINEGALMFNYCGHGSFSSMSAESPFSIADALSQYNDRMGLWYLASCNIGQFDGYVGSLGEAIMRNPNGTGIATIAAVRTSYSTGNAKLNSAFIKAVFDPENGYVVGDALRIAKNELYGDSNKMKYTLLGDPALRLVAPDLSVRTDSILTLSSDGVWVEDNSFSALDKVKLVGTILKDNGDVDESFNGEIIVSVKDKAQEVSTKGNQQSNGKPYVFKYMDYVNTLYSGSAVVSNGKFECVLIVPKDINFSLGNGRILYYAYDEDSNSEAMGHDNSIEIGGEPSVTEFETDGPKITMYLNKESFKNGDKVNPSPMLYVQVSDESGINASGCGIGHDISLYIDDSSLPINLNERFSYDKGSYTAGSLMYHLSTLAPGTHTLTVKVWDLVNNSSTQTITFVVDENLAPEVTEIIAYPVPAVDDITFEICTDRPDEVLDCKTGVFDVNGRQYYSSDFSSQPADGKVEVKWNLKDGKGSRLPAGVYIYRVELNTNHSESEIKTKKFIILPSK